MLHSIYTPLSGALAQEQVMNVLANNLANVNTAGFKEDRVTFKLLAPEPYQNYRDPLPPANYKVPAEQWFPLKGNEIAYVGVAGIERDQSIGPTITTNNPLDVMLEGPGLFAVSTTTGTQYTRDGSLTLGPNGALTSKRGDAVMGEKGLIFLQGGEVEINALGEIYQKGQFVDRLLVFQPDDHNALERVGGNMYMHNGSPESLKRIEHPAIRQGYLEGSNVNAIRNLTSMILAHRSFEAYQKALANYDRMMDKSSNQLGEVRA